MQYTSHCRAIMTIRIVNYLKEKMKDAKPNIATEAEYALADSSWFNMLVSSVTVVEVDQVLASLVEQENYYKHHQNDNRYTEITRNIFKEREKIYKEIQDIIHKCIDGKDTEI